MGALLKAKNVVIDKEGIIETRRGFKQYGTALTLSTGKIESLFNYGDTLLVHYHNKLAYDSDDAGTWLDYTGTYTKPTGAAKIRALEASKNFYFTTSAGVKKLDSVTGTVTSAGGIKALDGSAALSSAGSGFFALDNQLAYRIVWGFKDANNNLILGSPSQRIEITNPAGGADDTVALTFTVPSGVTTSHFYQIYRSVLSGGETIVANDELQLVIEDYPTAGEISAGTVTVTDDVPDTLRGATLYTSPSQQGILQSNDPPPLAKDICFFKNSVFYANTVNKQRYTLTLISVAGTDGLTYVVAATKEIQDLTYTAATAGSAGNSITVAYTAGGTAGSEVVTVVGTAISIQIEDGVSTADQIKAAFDLSADAIALASCAVSGVGGNAQNTVTATALAGGKDASTVTIGGVVYTGKTSETASSGEFKVTTSETAAENIDLTAQSLVRVINQYASNTTIYAYYMSGYNDLPGIILLEERTIGGSSFALVSNKGSAFNPTLPSSGTTQSSDNETYENRVYVSKQQQPEAVPIGNYIPVGSENKAILRIVPLRDSVFVFKEDGLFRITGESINDFKADRFDETVVLNASETVVPFQNQLFAYTSQGIVGVSDSGSAIQSRPIEVDLLENATFSSFNSLSFGVSYNSDRKYILFIQTDSTDTYCTQAYIYNSISQQWTRWERNFNCGIVNSADDLLYFGSADSAYVYQERKSFTLADYADEELAVTITGRSGTTVNMSSTTGIVAGDVLYQSGKKSVVVSVDSGTAVTVEDEKTWKSASATVYKPISVEVETIQQHAGNPGILKHFRDLVVLFRRANFTDLSIGIKSDISQVLDVTDLYPVNPIAWGGAPWGTFGWGGGESDFQVIRTLIPRNKQRGHWLKVNIAHSNARDYFAIAGMSLMFNNMRERFR